MTNHTLAMKTLADHCEVFYFTARHLSFPCRRESRFAFQKNKFINSKPRPGYINTKYGTTEGRPVFCISLLLTTCYLLLFISNSSCYDCHPYYMIPKILPPKPLHYYLLLFLLFLRHLLVMIYQR